MRIIYLLLLLIPLITRGQTNPNHKWVSGYTKSNGTYVSGHYRTESNYTNRDNFSTKGNVNPYTGKPGYIAPDNNYYSTYTTPTFNSYNYSNSTSVYLNDSRNGDNWNRSYPTSDSNYPTWSATYDGFKFFINGDNVSQSTKSEWQNDDLIVYYDNYAFKLPNFNSNKDNNLRKAEPLTTWKSLDNSYYFFYDGEGVADKTENYWRGNDLIVRYKNFAYLLKNYKNLKDGNIRTAYEYGTWKRAGDSYEFYHGDKNVSRETDYIRLGSSLVVEFDDKYFLCKSFFDINYSDYETALSLPKWKSTGDSYSFEIDGDGVANVTQNEWLNDNSLVVFYNNDGYILTDYKNKKDGLWRPAIPIATWKKVGESFYFFVLGDSVASMTTNDWSGNDLVVYYKDKKYLLKNFNKTSDEKLRYAILLK